MATDPESALNGGSSGTDQIDALQNMETGPIAGQPDGNDGTPAGTAVSGKKSRKISRAEALKNLEAPLTAAMVVASLLVTISYPALLQFPLWPGLVSSGNFEADPSPLPLQQLGFRVILYCNFVALALALVALLVLLNVAYWQGQFGTYGNLHPDYVKDSFKLAIIYLILSTLSLLGAFFAGQIVVLQLHGLADYPATIVAGILVFFGLSTYAFLGSYFTDTGENCFTNNMELWSLILAIAVFVVVVGLSYGRDPGVRWQDNL